MIDLPSERAVLGAALLGDTSLLLLSDEDFTDPRHRTLSQTIRDMLRRGEPVDLVTVSGKLFGRLSGVFIADVMAGCPMPTAGSWYAALVRSMTRARMAHGEAQQLAQLISGDPQGDDLTEIISLHTEALKRLPAAFTETEEPAVTISDLFEREYSHNWLVPGLLERPERIVVTAAEGTAKSTIATQWAVSLASGCHPWTGARIGAGLRVLLIDAENSEAQTQRRYRWVGERLQNPDPGWAKRIQVHIRPEGLDLPGRDRGWLAKVCAKASPDFIAIGPAYKLMRGDPQRDSDVLALLNVLDEIRIAHQSALMVEAHSGHAKDIDGSRAIRPYGSSVWLRWPETGIGLRRSEMDPGLMRAQELEVAHWRGSREDRDWPDLIRTGTDRELPWTPVRPDYGTDITPYWRAS